MEHGEESRLTPKNAKAVVDLDKPQRSIKLNWEAPEIVPKSYEVEAIPETGKHKIRRWEQTQMIFPRLKTFTNYEFQISAIYDDGERHSCKTEEQVRTYARLDKAIPAHFQHLSGTSIDQSNSSITNTTQLLSARPDGFDKVGNVEMNTLNEEGQEMATVTWDHPSFSGFYDDYEIIQYHVEVFQLSTKIFDDIYKYQKSPKTEKFSIELGESNTIRIRTKYEELDLEKILTSDFKISIPSRPTRPLVNWKIDGNTLDITWGSSIGVEKFRFEFKKASDNTVIKMEEGEKDFKKVTFEIDKEVYRGTSYIIDVTAIGKLGGTNTTTMDVLLGSDWAPRFSKVSLNIDDIHAVDISWERPDKSPHKYIIKAMNDPSIQQEVSGTQCTIWHLKAGTKYRFNIFAIYTDKLDDEYRCTTEEITTNPCPDQRIETLEISLSDDHPDSVLLINWEKINAATMYRVCITTEEKFAIECVTENNHYRAKGLESNTEYSVGISAGNDEGFGEQLSRTCKTAMRAPENITLSSLRSDHVEVRWTGDVTKTYEIRLHNAEDETLIHKKIVNSTHCTFTELAGHMSYYANIVIRCNNSERKRRSNVILTVPPVKRIKTLSSLVSEESISTDVCLHWENDQGSRAYDIEVRTDEKVENLLRVEDVNYHEYRCLKAGNLYEFRLRAVNSAGCGRWSAPKTIKLQNPKPPKKIQVTLDKEKPWKIANIKWDRPEGVSCFRVEILPSSTGEPQPPGHVLVNLDEIRPWHIAHITWPSSPGVDAYKISILPLMTSTSECIDQKKRSFRFEGKPGQEYTVMVYPGDGDGFFSSSFAESTFRLDQIRTIDEESIEATSNADATDIDLKWKTPDGVDRSKISWRDLQNRGTNGTATVAESHFKITSANSYNQLEVEVSPISGNDIGMASRKNILLKPVINSARVEGQNSRYVWVNVRTTMDITKTIVTAKAETSAAGNIIRTSEVTRQEPIIVEFDKLKPGESYNFYATVERGNFTSSESYAGCQTIRHGKLQNLRIVELSGCMVTAEWDHPEIKPVGGYSYLCHPSSVTQPISSQQWQVVAENKIPISNLVAGSEYILQVVAQEKHIMSILENDEKISSVIFRTAPEKLGRPSIPHLHSSEKVDILWRTSNTADSYVVTLKIFDDESVVERTYQTQHPWYTLDGLKRGTKYTVHVRGKNEAGSGELSDALHFETEFNTSEIVSRVKELSALNFKSRLPEHFIKPTLKDANGNAVELDGVIHENSGSISLMEIPSHGGLTSLCYYIADELCSVCSEKIVFYMSYRNIFGSKFQLFITHLKTDLKLELSECEMELFFRWLNDNSENVVFVMDRVLCGSEPVSESTTIFSDDLTPLSSFAAFLSQILERAYFKNATIFVGEHHRLKIQLGKTLRVESYDIESIRGLVEKSNKSGLENWDKVRSHSKLLCSSAKSCFLIMELIHSHSHEIDFSSPACVHLHFYTMLYKKENLHITFDECENAYKLLMINENKDFDGLPPEQKFLLAMYAVFCFDNVSVVEDLVRYLPNSTFTLMCAGLLNPKYDELAFSMLNSHMKQIEKLKEAAYLCKEKRKRAVDVILVTERLKKIRKEIGADPPIERKNFYSPFD